MAVPALELKPRQTVALFDAALRLCARSTGVWSLTLPAGACVIAAVFHLVDSISRHRAPLEPVALFTAAWIFRAISMGAACHFLEGQVLGTTEPNTWTSFVAALKRAPSLIITAAFTAMFNGLIWCLTLGVGFLFLGAQNVAYAVAMRGQGHPLAVYATASKLLGPARHTAAWVRLCFLSQLLVLLNLHLVTASVLYLGKSLLALDLTFVERFTSLDNATWVAALVATTFALFEPLRAATSTLLLIDGRVRQEGLDLLATLEQLPRRRKPRAPIAAAVGLLFALLPFAARAQDDWSGVYTPGHTEEPSANAQNLKDRLQDIVDECDLSNQISPDQLDAAGGLSAEHQSSLSRFVARIERRAWDDEDCEGAAADLRRGLALITQTQQLAQDSAPSTRDEAKAILARPEFAVVDPAEKKAKQLEDDQAPGWFSKAWNAFWDAIWRWLKGLKGDPDSQADLDGPNLSGGGMGFANVVVVVAIIGVVGFLLWLLIRSRDTQRAADAGADISSLTETPLSSDPMSALARAPESWAGLADQLAREGKYREAIRHLYLALLSRLHRDGAIDYDPAKSNWDYFRGFKGRAGVLGPFRELTRRFDFAWYGNLEVGQASWNTFRGTCEPILAADPQGMASGA
jgi:hypothetical protein